jgi:hypothetical protein
MRAIGSSLDGFTNPAVVSSSETVPLAPLSRPDQENVDGVGVVGQLVGVVVEVLEGAAVFPSEHAGLDERDSAHAPLGVGELAQQGPLDGAGGLEFVFQFGDQDVEIVEIFAGQDGGLGAQAVLEGVLG